MTEEEQASLLALYPNSKKDQDAIRKLFEQSRDLVLPLKLAKISAKCERSLWRLISLSPMKAFPAIAERLDVEPEDTIEVESKRVLGGKMSRYETRLTGRQVLELEKMEIPGLNIEDCGTYCITIEAADKHAAVKALVGLGVSEKRIKVSETRGTIAKSDVPAEELEKIGGIFEDPAADVLEFKPNITRDQIKALDAGQKTKTKLQKAHSKTTLLAGLGKEEAEELASQATSPIKKTGPFWMLIAVDRV